MNSPPTFEYWLMHIAISALLILTAANSPLTVAQEILRVEDIRIGHNPGRSRIVFDLSGPSRYCWQERESPAQIIINLGDTQSAIDLTNVAFAGTPILSADSVTAGESGLRYEFRIQEGTRAELFRLPPYQQRGYRLVLDLYHAVPHQGDTPANNEQSQADQSAGSPATSTRTTRPVTTPYPASAVSNPPREAIRGEWSGYLSLDARLFPDSPEYAGQDDQNASIAAQPEYYVDWDQGRQQFAFRGFYRLDANDHRRTHGDIRELYWRMEQDRFVFKAGLDVVFWGVAESQHLVDIINQTDLVENIDGEEKLGQPMLNLDYLSDYGNWQFYILPYFRERTFPGKNGRLRTNPVVDTGEAQYESGSKEEHVDFALRWSNYIGDWDIGLAHFSGTAREPLLLLEVIDGKSKLIPLYLQIDQSSLDVQATKGAWLWKLEALYNWNDYEDYYASVGGFEYTQFGVADSAADLGWLLEYHYDERGDRATNGLQSDIYLGMRLTANDFAGTMALFGILYDTDTESFFGNIEASRRLNENWTLGLELRFTTNSDEEENLYFIRADDYLGLELTRYF